MCVSDCVIQDEARNGKTAGAICVLLYCVASEKHATKIIVNGYHNHECCCNEACRILTELAVIESIFE